MAGESAQELPIFELPVVLLPGERLPLHIFEDRYKKLIGHVLDEGEPFGIVFRDDEGARRIGCTARVDEVLDRFDDGRMNVLVSGEYPFRVLDRFESTEFPAGEVELIDEESAPIEDDDAAEGAREAFAELAERAIGERPDDAELSAADAYALAARVELPDDTKQRLLELRDEDERFRLLKRAFVAVEEAVERSEEISEHARSNGKVDFG
jgi:Lon protease-like protein